MKRISDRIIVCEYLNVNVTAIESKNGILIIDTHRSPATMNEIKRLIEKEFGRKDFLYVINSHADYDHSSGNQVFPGVTIIGHDNCSESMRQSPAYSVQTISYLKSNIDEMVGGLKNRNKDLQVGNELQAEIDIWTQMVESIEHEYIVTPPTKTFSDSLILHLNDLTVKMIYCGKAHTDNDIFIYIPEEKLVFTGDVFTSKNSFGFSVNKMNDVQRVSSSMDRILQDSSGVKYIIPGHGEYFSQNDFVDLRNLLQEMYDKYQGALSAVKLLESMIETDGLNTGLQKYSEIVSIKKNKYYLQEEEFNILGRRFLKKGKIDEAIGVFTQSIKAFPKSALGYDNLGGAYVKKGEVDSAIFYYKKSLELFPENRNTQEILKTIRLKR